MAENVLRDNRLNLEVPNFEVLNFEANFEANFGLEVAVGRLEMTLWVAGNY